MAALPDASEKTVSCADGNLSVGTENVPPAENPSWRDRFRRLVYPALRSLAIRALPVLSKSIHEGFNKLDPATRANMVRGWVILATFLVLALAVPPLLLVYFVGQQVWVMAAALCFYVFFLLFLCVWWKWNWRRRRYPELICLTCGLLLVFFATGVIGPPRTAVVVLYLTTAWAAGHLGYSLALDRLRAYLVIKALFRGFRPSRHSKETAEELPQPISTGWFVVAVLWTTLISAILYGQRMGKALDLDVIFALSYVCEAGELMNWNLGLLRFEEPLPLLLVPCGIASPLVGLLFAVPSGLFQWMLLMALVTFLGYNVTVYLYIRDD